ncbi:MAG TPA: hypothetical protein VFW90_04075, partial [Candidatus Saccharimonadales bacterium]|nr:hypothetical protein [Candidatus Saccharimonadales bacterium]
LLSEMSQMADNVVVIGKGKMIADTSINKLVSGAGRGVFARVSGAGAFQKALDAAGFKYEKSDDGLTISSATTDEIGKLAFKNGSTVLELTARTASLEQAFLELTEGEAEYEGHAQKESK